ncbi:hypothetical protein Cme02nite_23240 [Catellatospora methionotrophica]|uniref:Bacterial SCP orthologue domain-containing protein n=1 Tax=Catellatospora methionotrophica TaxID=121620 RepID=A0A8J3L3R3_9ACTN|nr:sterol carrier family protein [Catellatospora methionotrophica]GIG13992.1 hypothetical protein Cme02nite_23240 [Catellatospora methionotrophica]
MSPSPEISPAVTAALDCLATGQTPERLTLRDAVRALLAHLAATAPGRSVEVRIPPYGAIQCVAGPTHTRGTPPNLVETDPVTFLLLAAGRVEWVTAVADGRIRASGIRSDISSLFPIV